MTWDDLCRQAEYHGFRRAGFGTRLEGHGFWLERQEHGVRVKNHLIPSFNAKLTLTEAAEWIARNQWK